MITLLIIAISAFLVSIFLNKILKKYNKNTTVIEETKIGDIKFFIEDQKSGEFYEIDIKNYSLKEGDIIYEGRIYKKYEINIFLNNKQK